MESLCRYRGRAIFDEVLHVHASVENMGNSSFKFRFVVSEEASGRLICTGHIVAVAVDKKTGGPVPMPQGFIEAEEGFEGKTG